MDMNLDYSCLGDYMKLYVMRHGKTNLNEEHRYNCRLEEDLNQTGISQAEETREKIKI